MCVCVCVCVLHVYIYILYVCVCVCIYTYNIYILKNLLDEKGIQDKYSDVSKIPHELLTYLRMYSNTYPIVLGGKYFSLSMRR
jgi:hypothetical protein